MPIDSRIAEAHARKKIVRQLLSAQHRDGRLYYVFIKFVKGKIGVKLYVGVKTFLLGNYVIAENIRIALFTELNVWN